MKIKQTQQYHNRKLRVVIPVILISAVLLIAAAVYLRSFLFADTSSPQPGEKTINLERSDSEKKASENITQHPEEKLKNPSTDIPPQPVTNPNTGLQEANVLVTNVGIFNNIVSASGMVTNLTEEGGICTYVFQKNSVSIEKKSKSLVNPTSLTCETVSFPVDELSERGDWSVSLKYTSNTATGVSPTKELTR